LERKKIITWCLYDWAGNAFSTIIITFIFSSYFTKSIMPNIITGTSYWGWAISLSGILIALTSPFIGLIANNNAKRNPLFRLLTLLCIILTATLFFSTPKSNHIATTLGVVVIANTAFELALIIYNGYLYQLVEKQYYGRISGWGWGSGYAGGLCVLVISLWLIGSGVFTSSNSLNIRVTSILAAGWMLIFSLPLLVNLPRTKLKNIAPTKLKEHLAELKATLSYIICNRKILFFMLARLFYIDGLNTIFAFGGIYASGTFHLNFHQILEFAIGINISAGLGCLAFAWLDDKIGADKVIVTALIGLFLSTLTILITHNLHVFWVVSIGLGIFVGPLQASSRSYMIRLCNKNNVYKLFGFYSLVGKVTAFIGPFFVALLTEQFQSQRAGMSTVCVMLTIGLIIFIYSIKTPTKST
jgi:MFS transporter, UMF1 family